MEQFLEVQQKFANLMVDDMEDRKHEAEEFNKEQLLEVVQQKFENLTVDDMEDRKCEVKEFTAEESYLSHCPGCKICATLSEAEKRFLMQYCKV